jgi:hypothetical protein
MTAGKWGAVLSVLIGVGGIAATFVAPMLTTEKKRLTHEVRSKTTFATPTAISRPSGILRPDCRLRERRGRLEVAVLRR